MVAPNPCVGEEALTKHYILMSSLAIVCAVLCPQFVSLSSAWAQGATLPGTVGEFSKDRKLPGDGGGGYQDLDPYEKRSGMRSQSDLRPAPDRAVIPDPPPAPDRAVGPDPPLAPDRAVGPDPPP